MTVPLGPGGVIVTGTPGTPGTPVPVQPGDVVELLDDDIGTLSNPVVRS
ncbi:fumarylacetoacetate hydrolase family protein [Streptomyces sp. RTGN2]|nr:fumarylacetoacetate hydrolase family protein [Streptomyces sp. RTGN2]